MHFKALDPEELTARLAAMVDSSDDAIFGADAAGTINTWNAAATEMLGYRADEIVGQSVFVLIPPTLHAEHRGLLDRLRAGERVSHYETVLVRKGGDRVDVSLAISPVRNDQGKLIGTAAVARDVGRNQRDHAAQSRLAAIVESSDDAIYARDLNGIITDWNAAAERMFGYKADEVIGRSILTIIPPELQHEELAILGKIRAGERIEHYETERLHKDGRRVAVSLTTSPIRSAGRVIGASKIARDISDRRVNEHARLMLAAIVESSDDAIISKTLDGIITSWNAAAQRLFGYTAEEIVGHSVLRLLPPELYDEEPGIIAKLRNGERIDHFETRRVKKSGEVFDISLTVSPIRNKNGKIIGASKIVRDISDRKRAEALLIEKEKLEAIGRLAATLAHEVNNPLESIMNLSYLVAHHPALPVDLRGFAELLVKEVDRAGEITRQVLSFHREPRVAAPVDVAENVRLILAAKRTKLQAKDIDVHTDMNARMAHGFAGELRQVLDNVIDNAIDASPRAGVINIRTRRSTAAGADRIILTVCDNGPGISPEMLPRIFSPFVTTKAANGSGLGLWVSQGIVQKHNGTIRVRSATEHPGRPKKTGSVFRISLPASEEVATEDAVLPARRAAS